MLLQTNSYIVPKDKRPEHARLVRRFRQTLARLGCEHFEVYEQVGANWGGGESTGRYVHIMRFRDRKHQLAVQAAERNDAPAQALITEFCELINFPYQQQQGLFAVGFYQSALPVASARPNVAPPLDDATLAPAAQGDEEQQQSSSEAIEGEAVGVDTGTDDGGDAVAADPYDDVLPEIEADGATAEDTLHDALHDVVIDDDDANTDEPAQRRND